MGHEINKNPGENPEQPMQNSEAVLRLYGFLSEATEFTFDEVQFHIVMLLIYLEENYNLSEEGLQVSSEAGYIYINDGTTFISVGTAFFTVESSVDERIQAIEEISFDEAAANYQESISQFRESVVEIDVLSDAINRALEDNDNEAWEVIDENDIIAQGPFQGKTLVEAILIYKQKILNSSQNLRNLGNVDITEYPEIGEAKEKLYDANENYLLLILGIGEKREELTHVIPKSQSECLTLIQAVVNRRNPREILDWMKEIHAQIDANNWQDGTVEKNYKFFSDTLSTLALIKIKNDIFENSKSENYRKPDLLLEFAVLVSGRAAWNKESGLFMNDIGENASPVDSRLWMPELAEEALVYAMDLPQENESGESQSMISEMMKHIEISDPLLGGQTPQGVITSTIDKIKNSVLAPSTIEGGGTLGSVDNFDEILDGLGYSDIIVKLGSGNLGATYQDLSLQEMISISGLLRISQGITKKQTHTRTEMRSTPYIAQTGETVQNHGNQGPGAAYICVIKTISGAISYEDFGEVAKNAGQESVQHIGSELDKNFDDSWSQIWENRMMSDEDGDGNITNEANKNRAERFGVSGNINSLEYQIFTLYNDINGNGEVGEVSDTTRDGLKTAGFMLAMVAGSMLIGGGIVSAIHLARAAQLGITISKLALQGGTLGIAAQGSIMGMSGSALGYGIDAVAGDARGFYTPSEAMLGVGGDFLLGGATGALSGPLAKFLPDGTPNSVIFGIDLTFLGLGPEFYRMSRMNEAWHGSEIFTPNSGSGSIESHITATEKNLLSYELNSTQMEEYFKDEPNWDLLPHGFENYRFFSQNFAMMGFESDMIPAEFDKEFRHAYGVWKLLNPGNSLNIWQSEPEFEGVINNRDGGLVGFHQRIIEATEKWIARQERRFSEIT